MTKPKIRQIDTVPFLATGAASDDLVDGAMLALQALGDGADDHNSGPIAFAYLCRRFGPALHEGDSYKQMGEWILTTPDPEVLLTIGPSLSPIYLSIGYLVSRTACVGMYAARTAWLKQARALFQRLHPFAGEDVYIDWMQRCRPAIDAIIGPLPEEPDPQDWQTCGTDLQRRINGALYTTLQSLLRQVSVRDGAFTILGNTTRPAVHNAWAAKHTAYLASLRDTFKEQP